MEKLEAGIRIEEDGLVYFGLEQINQKLKTGAIIKELQPGGVVMSKTGEDEENMTLAIGGCQIVVVFESWQQ